MQREIEWQWGWRLVPSTKRKARSLAQVARVYKDWIGALCSGSVFCEFAMLRCNTIRAKYNRISNRRDNVIAAYTPRSRGDPPLPMCKADSLIQFTAISHAASVLPSPPALHGDRSGTMVLVTCGAPRRARYIDALLGAGLDVGARPQGGSQQRLLCKSQGLH